MRNKMLDPSLSPASLAGLPSLALLDKRVKQVVSNVETEKCVVCRNVIDPASLSFEQRLIEDKDFCRKCWDAVMEVRPEEIRLPVLIVKE
jgi:hypothetical protein